MIAATLGLVSLMLLASVMGYGIGTNSNLLMQSRLNEELKAVSLLIGRELRRAGYNANSILMVADPVANPSPFRNSLQVSAYAGEAADSCILFSYDQDADGVLDVLAGNENFGFRLRDEAIEMRQGSLTCTEAGWQDLTDTGMVEVSQLQFVLNQVVSNNVTRSDVTFTITGHLTDNPNISRTYQETISVRSYD